MVGPSIDHLRSFNQSPVPLIELKKLSPLLASTDVYLAVHRALQNGAEVTERVLNLLQVNGLAREVLEIMHDYLLPVGHEHSDSVVFRVLLKTPLGLLDLHFYLLKAAQVNFRQNFVLNLFKVLFLELYLIRNRDDLLFKLIDLVLVDRDMLDLVPHQPRLPWNLLLLILIILHLRALSLLGVVYCLLYPLLEIEDFVVDKVLVDLHFFLEVPHLSFVYKLENS